MKNLRLSMTVIILSVLLGGCGMTKLWSRSDEPALSGRLTGTVTYRERVALPPNARVIVSLEDVSGNASGAFIAQQTLQPKTQVPFNFDLRYIPSAIDRRHDYALRASIVDAQDELLWSSANPLSVSLIRPDQAIVLTVERVDNPVKPEIVLNKAIGYKCDDFAFIARFSDGKVEIATAGRALMLPQVISGSGARYSNGTTTLWSRGDAVSFEMNGISYQNCKADPIPEAK
jgi:putative lipoprotein